MSGNECGGNVRLTKMEKNLKYPKTRELNHERTIIKHNWLQRDFNIDDIPFCNKLSHGVIKISPVM